MEKKELKPTNNKSLNKRDRYNFFRLINRPHLFPKCWLFNCTAWSASALVLNWTNPSPVGLPSFPGSFPKTNSSTFKPKIPKFGLPYKNYFNFFKLKFQKFKPNFNKFFTFEKINHIFPFTVERKAANAYKAFISSVVFDLRTTYNLIHFHVPNLKN